MVIPVGFEQSPPPVISGFWQIKESQPAIFRELTSPAATSQFTGKIKKSEGKQTVREWMTRLIRMASQKNPDNGA